MKRRVVNILVKLIVNIQVTVATVKRNKGTSLFGISLCSLPQALLETQKTLLL